MWENAVNEMIKGDFILGMFLAVMAFVTTIVNIILYPFNLLIESLLPDLANALESLAEYFAYAGTYIAWLLDALAIPQVVVVMVGAYWLFVFTTTFGAWAVKLILKWKKALWV